jgi:MFS family permease
MALFGRGTLTFCFRGNEIGPFRAIEESTIAHLTSKEDRSDIYAWYSLIGTAGTALGFVGCGWIITFLRDEKHFDSIEAYRIIFFGYAVVGIVKLCLALLLSKACELDVEPKASSTAETAPLLGNATAATKDENDRKKRRWRLLPDISKDSQVVLVQLCILFAFDNLASGLAPL